MDTLKVNLGKIKEMKLPPSASPNRGGIPKPTTPNRRGIPKPTNITLEEEKVSTPGPKKLKIKIKKSTNETISPIEFNEK